MWHVWGEGEAQQRYWWGNLREMDWLENLGVDEQTVIKCIFKKRDGGMDWIDLAQGRDRWWTVVNAEMNRRVS